MSFADGRRNPFGALTDVTGVLVGHADRRGDGWLTGCTVVVPPPGSTGGVDVRGGGPATLETDALRPGTLSGRVDAVLLTGGSAYGLPAVAGVQRWCERAGRGFPVGPGGQVVPIVPAVALFDLGRGGDFSARPDAALAMEATENNSGTGVPTGVVGAGTGALAAAGRLKGGVGTASVTLPGGVVVGALVVLNAAGSPLDPATGALLGAPAVSDPALRPRVPGAAEHSAVTAAVSSAPAASAPPRNTTLVVVAASAALSPTSASRLAVAGQAGLTRAVHPVHTLADGDTVLALATGEHDVAAAAPPQPAGWPVPAAVSGEVAVQAAASTAVTLAVLDAVLASRTTATATGDVPGYLDLYPSARPPGW